MIRIGSLSVVACIFALSARLDAVENHRSPSAPIPAFTRTEGPSEAMGSPMGLPSTGRWPERAYTTLPPPPGWTAEEFTQLARKPLTDSFDEREDSLLATSRLSSHKNGFFQKLSFSAAWLNRAGESSLGMTEMRTFLTVAVPAPTRDYPLLISPGFDVTALNGPATPDLPAQVYDAHVEFMWLPKLSERWLGILSVAPGVYSDFEGMKSSALRVQARALARYDWIPDRLQFVFGLLYLDRYDVNWLPAGGLIWAPNNDSRYELVFPRPKLSHCITRSGLHEDWVYLAGEFGGDLWTISGPGRSSDKMILRDYRVFLGIERKREGGAGHRIEIGYIFSRDIEFKSTNREYHPGDTVMLRAGFDF